MAIVALSGVPWGARCEEESAVFENRIERDPALNKPFRVMMHPGCTLEVAGKIEKVKSDLDPREPHFYFRVPLRITNAGRNPVSLTGYGNWSLPTHCQKRAADETKWLNVEVQGLCGTGLGFFTLEPGESRTFETSMPAGPPGTEFRIGVGVVDGALKPSDRIVFTVPQVVPKE